MSGSKLITSNDDKLWPWAGRALVGSTLFAAVALLVFRQFPAIDIFFSTPFFIEQTCSSSSAIHPCGKFWMVYDFNWRSVRRIGLMLPLIVMALVCLWLAWLLMFKARKSRNDLLPPFVAIFAAALGPGLITNAFLKENWGRPRPFVTEMFGGEFPYVPPGTISSYCQTNCSFVSGEASAAFWMLVLCLFFAGRRRNRIGLFIAVLAFAIAFLRVAFGRHFFSDIFMAGMVSLVCMFFWAWLFQTPLVQRAFDWLVGFSNTYAFGARKFA